MTRFFHKALLAASSALLFLTILAMAQQQAQSPDNSGQSQTAPPDNGQRPGRFGAVQKQRQRMAELAQKLNLTDSQKQVFQEISRNMRRQSMSIRQDSSLTEDQKKEKMQQLRKQSHQEMFAVLTQEQKDKLKLMREQHQKDQQKSTMPGNQASAKAKPGTAGEEDDPFAGMTSDDDDGPGNGGF